MRVIYVPSDLQCWVDVAISMHKSHGWHPVYWIAPNAEQTMRIKKEFPNIFVHDFFKGNMGELELPSYIKTPIKIDAPLIETYSLHEKMTIKMMDRLDPTGNSFGCTSRLDRYYRLLEYWISVIKTMLPDIVVFAESPHSPFSYMLYAVCKEEKIKIIRYVPTHINCKVFIDGPMEMDNQLLLHTMREVDGPPKDSVMDQYMKKISGSYAEAKPYYMESIVDDNALIFRSEEIVNNFRKALKFLFNPPRTYLEKIAQKKGVLRGIALIYYKIYGNLKKYFLRRSYEKIAVIPDYNVPYIYLPLHYQPEKTTAPEGGIYADQILMIKLISASLPHGWNLYVKEHPSQFSSKLYGEQGREVDAYHEINSLNNVRLIRVQEDSFTLIDHAKAVATVTGTAGLEAVIRGCSAFVFGYAWYRSCPGVYFIHSQEDLKKAIKVISEDGGIYYKEVGRFLSAVDSISKQAFLNPGNRTACSITEEENGKNLYELLANYSNKMNTINNNE